MQVGLDEVERLAEIGRRGRPVRIAFAVLVCLVAGPILSLPVLGAFLGLILIYEFGLGQWMHNRLVGPPGQLLARGPAFSHRLGLVAGVFGAALYCWIAIPAWAGGTQAGVVLAIAWTIGAVIHTMAYYSSDRIVLSWSLLMPTLYILAAPLFSPGGYGLQDVLCIVFWFTLAAAAATFAVERNDLVRQTLAARTGAEEAMAESEAKGRFLAAMSHELRTPLNAIIGYAQLAREEMAFGDRPDPQDMDRIERQARHLLGLITDILDYSRLDAGQMALHPVPTDPAAILDQVAEALLPAARSKGIGLTVGSGTPLPPLMLDPRRTYQCVLNLAANAVKFTEDGGVTLSAELVAAPDGPWLHLHVRDTGIGIDPAVIDRLFRPFSQIDNTMTRHHEGSGLGLVIARALARQMGGDVLVHSTAGAGSVFSLTVPARAARGDNPSGGGLAQTGC